MTDKVANGRVESDNRLSEPGKEARSWFKTLSAEKRAAIQKLNQIQPVWNVVGLLFVFIWIIAGMVILTAPVWPVRLAAYITIGLVIHGMVALLHETIHGNTFRKRHLDYWTGLVTGIPGLLSVTAYRVTHLPHHWYNRTEKDPNEIMNLTKNGRLLSIVFYCWIFIGMFFVILATPFTSQQYAQPRERRMIAAEYVGIATLIAALVLLGMQYGFLGAILQLWGIPLIFAAIIGNVRGWAEHMMTLRGHPLTQSRTVTSNRILSFLFLNSNYHLEHHLFPGMPWYNLPKLHALLQSEYSSAGTYIYKSYTRFLVDAFLIGVHGIAPKRVRLPDRLAAHVTPGN